MSPTNEIKPKSLSRDQLVVEDLGTELMIYDQKRNRSVLPQSKSRFCLASIAGDGQDNGRRTSSKISAFVRRNDR